MLKKSCTMFLTGACLIILGTAASMAAPVTFYDNLGTTYQGLFPFYGTNVWGLNQQGWATEFTAAGSGNVTQINVPVDVHMINSTITSDFQLEVFSNLSDAPIYTNNQTATATYPLPADQNPLDDLMSINVSGLSLTSGDTYWLALVANDPNTDVDWYYSSSGTGVTDYLTNNVWTAWTTNGTMAAFQIVGNDGTGTGGGGAVPEPSTILLFGAGLAGLARLARSKKS